MCAFNYFIILVFFHIFHCVFVRIVFDWFISLSECFLVFVYLYIYIFSDENVKMQRNKKEMENFTNKRIHAHLLSSIEYEDMFEHV